MTVGIFKKIVNAADKVVFGNTSDAHSDTKSVTEAVKKAAEKRKGDQK